MNTRFEAIKARLEVERQRLADEIKLRRSECADESRQGSPFGVTEETARESFELERQFAMVQRMMEQLAEVEHALDKLAKGTYGRCDACGKPIPPARLEAIPQANLCLDCKSLHNKRRLLRPVAAAH